MNKQRTWFQFLLGTNVRVTVVVLVVYALWMTFIDPVPLDTLSLAGRQALVLDTRGIVNQYGTYLRLDEFDPERGYISREDLERDRLRLVTYYWFNIKTSKLMPNTPILDFFDGVGDGNKPIWRPTAILDNGTVVWTDTRDGENYKIMKYEGGKTSLVTSIPIFDLPSFAEAYEKGEVSITPDTLNKTGDIYRAPFILYPDNAIGFLDAMVTKGDGVYLTELALRERNIDVVTGSEYGRNDIMSTSDFRIKFSEDLYAEHAPYYGFQYDVPDSEELVTFRLMVPGSKTRAPTIINDIGLHYVDADIVTFDGRVSSTTPRDFNFSSNATLKCSLKTDNSCELLNLKEYGPYLDPEGKRQLSVDTNKTLFSLGTCDSRFSSGPAICFGGLIESKLSRYDEGVEHVLMRAYSGRAFFLLWWLHSITDLTLSDDRTTAIITMNNTRLKYPQIAIDVNTGARATLSYDRGSNEFIYLK